MPIPTIAGSLVIIAAGLAPLGRNPRMRIDSTRFGAVTIEPEDILTFPHGLIGWEDLRHWVLLCDAENASLGWLQCVGRPEVALPVVSPRRYVPGYQARVKKSQLLPLEIAEEHQAFVLTVLARNEGQLTVNLRAPIVVNLDRRLGRQVVTTDEQPLSLVLAASRELRQSA
jgi:flagellar assembly factor FliW